MGGLGEEVARGVGEEGWLVGGRWSMSLGHYVDRLVGARRSMSLGHYVDRLVGIARGHLPGGGFGIGKVPRCL